MRFFCLFFIAAMGAFAPGGAQAQVDDGFMVIPRDAWRTSDTGRVEACTAVKEEIGVLSNTYTCTRWGSLQEWLTHRMKAPSAPVLTRWDYQCQARMTGAGSRNAQMTCNDALVLYYRLTSSTR